MKIKVKIEYTVEVDVDFWAEEYGLEPSAKAVRADVKEYFTDIAHCPYADTTAEDERDRAVRIV